MPSRDETIKTLPGMIRGLVRAHAASSTTSLRDRPEAARQGKNARPALPSPSHSCKKRPDT
jgi:hypothetical protein